MIYTKQLGMYFFFVIIATICFTFSNIMADSKSLVFKETIIEGKIKRPQVVLISANSRPVFGSMAINSHEDSTTLVNTISLEIFEQREFESAIKLEFK